MHVDQQPAFVLHSRPYRETSLLLELLSRDHGRVGAVARGVRNARARLSRNLLQALTPLSVSWAGAGELVTLTGAEAVGTPFALAGESLLCALYLNELVARLLPRNDAHGDVFEAYWAALTRLAGAEPAAWTLRRFERDLLGELGYGPVLEHEAESEAPIDPGAHYAYRLDAGPVPWRGVADGLKLRGAALLALARDEMPQGEDLIALRRLMRALIAHHLDGPGLRAWALFQAGSGKV